MKQLVHLFFLVCQCHYYTTTPFPHFLANTPPVSSLWLTKKLHSVMCSEKKAGKKVTMKTGCITVKLVGKAD